MCIRDRVSSHSSYNLLFSEKIQLHFVLVLWRVIGHPYIESATALSDNYDAYLWLEPIKGLLLEKPICLPAAGLQLVTVARYLTYSQSLLVLLSAFFPLTGKCTGKVCSLGEL